VADGCVIGECALIENSVIGLRCRIEPGAVIRNSILMGNDFYESPEQHARDAQSGLPPMGIGSGARIEKAIIDKNCHIGKNVRIVNAQGVDSSEETEHGMIRDGVAVVPKRACLPDGWTL
jgi:glucose-1-phosphate adenylyltransferase